MINLYKIADRNICIDSISAAVHRLCAEYRIEGDIVPDIVVRISKADIEYERKKADREHMLELGDEQVPGDSTSQFSDRYLESLAVYRKIAEQMPFFDTVLMHGSCISADSTAYLFTAKSGTGKSTHTRLWRELLGDRAFMVNDDKPMIRLTENGPVVYGTPWDGKHMLSMNVSLPLKAICILERAEVNTIRRITPAEAYPMFLQQVYRPGNTEALQKTLTLIDRLTMETSLWRMGCNISPEAAQMAFDAMSK